MTEPLLDRFDLAQDALKTAIGRDLEGAIQYFDKHVDNTFNEILVASPDTSDSKTRLAEFLLDYCCETCSGKSTAHAAKQRLLELIR